MTQPTDTHATDDNSRSRTSLSSVSNALRILQAFTFESYELGITELAKEVGIAKSTAHRIVSSMVVEGFLEKNPVNEKYRLGLTLFRLGALVRQRMSLSTEARPYLMELRAKTNETVLLAVPDANQILYVFHLESSHAIRMRSDIGVRKPMLCTAEGQTLLAFMSREHSEQILQSSELAERTPYTLTDLNRLKQKLDTIRQQGYSLEDQESEVGMRSIAAPVFDSDRKVVGSVALAGPLVRMNDEVIPQLAQDVIATALQISRRIGYPL